MKKLKSHFEITQAQRRGILTLLALSSGLFLGLYAFKNHSKDKGLKISEVDKKSLLKLQQQLNEAENRFSSQKEPLAGKISSFDPNRLDLKGWRGLGFSEKQAQVIIKYRNSLGGFTSPDQIKKCFVISDEKFRQLKPYIRLKNKPSPIPPTTPSPIKTPPKLMAFDPNRLERKDWENLGFSPKQAMTILKYKKSIGGFSSLEQIRKCFVISDEKFQQLKPYIQLNISSSAQDLKSIPSSSSKKDLNRVDWEALSKYVDQEKIARRVINYRNALGGFVSTTQLKEVYGLSATSIEKITANFEVSDPRSVQKISINQAVIRDLKKHPYLRAFAQKIIEYREKNGPFGQLEDLKKIKEIGEENFQRIRLYLNP